MHTALLDLKQKESTWQSARAEHEKTKRRVVETQQRHRIEIADSAFFEKEHCEKHQATPWWPIAAQRARDEVFIAAMALHRAFVDAWLNERVGTVHTAQGREAEAVIIVLGAPNPSQTGARNWAGSRPNILNVAVTRAKEVVYVVGNRKLWREAGVFAELDRQLP